MIINCAHTPVFKNILIPSLYVQLKCLTQELQQWKKHWMNRQKRKTRGKKRNICCRCPRLGEHEESLGVTILSSLQFSSIDFTENKTNKNFNCSCSYYNVCAFFLSFSLLFVVVCIGFLLFVNCPCSSCLLIHGLCTVALYLRSLQPSIHLWTHPSSMWKKRTEPTPIYLSTSSPLNPPSSPLHPRWGQSVPTPHLSASIATLAFCSEATCG